MIDVLVIGGGNAGLCAAITAAEAGARVLVIEHAPMAMRGGNTRHTRNLRAMHDGPAHTLSGSYSEAAFWSDLQRVTQGQTHEPLARQMIRGSRELLDWLHARGVRYQPALRGTLSLEYTNAFFLGGGKALLNALYRTAQSLGVQVMYDTEVTGLQIDAGAVRDVQVCVGGQTQTIAARAVVVASGGFQANADWMRQVWGPAADNFLIRGTPYNRGRVLCDLIRQGVDTVADADQCHAVAIDARAPRHDGGIVSRLDCVCFGVVVNRQGRRFYDEGEDFWPRRYAIWGRLIAQQSGQIAYAIVDDKVVNNYMPSLYPPLEADSIADLARLLEVSAEELGTTIDAFNRACVPGSYDPGELDSCHTHGLSPAKSHWALPLDSPPFRAYPLRPGITFTYLGLKVDSAARVHIAGRPCANLFAAGEVMAGNILGHGYCAGTGMSIGGVFGRIAGGQAACAAQN